MLKMMLDPMGGIVFTNDGNAILREIEVSHPAAKSMLELSRAQDEETGDGTTSVIVLGMRCNPYSTHHKVRTQLGHEWQSSIEQKPPTFNSNHHHHHHSNMMIF
jgi:hypothetical protein